MQTKFNLNQMLAGAAGLVALGLFLQVQGLPSFGSRNPKVECSPDKPVQSQSRLSGSQLVKLLNVKKGNSKDSVRSVLDEPYCSMTELKIRAGTISQREVYLLAADEFVQFDPKTRLVVLYEGDQYTGFKFWVK
jgi:hypothetical protein